MTPTALPQFEPQLSIYSARAPGRLDVMGGVSDYSGGTCLEWPLQVATTCRMQPRNEPTFLCFGGSALDEGGPGTFAISREELRSLDYASVRKICGRPGDLTRYVPGCFVVLHQEKGFFPTGGALIGIESTVPAGAGVSSSAALKVATMSAIVRAYQLPICGHEIALLAQKIEGHVAGTPNGLRDQLAVSMGRRGHLLRLSCQPDLVEGYVSPPEGVTFIGVGSGVRHSAGRIAYDKSRTAAFMGRALVTERAREALRGPDDNLYLANLGSDLWRALRMGVPEELWGHQFLRDTDDHGDPDTRVAPDELYKVRLAAEHPVYEADRVKRFARLLHAAGENPGARAEFLAAAGDLMVQSHFSYDHRCQLGSPETDLLVELAREAGPSEGIYGAKITGDGAGGTVAILGDLQLNSNLPEVVAGIAATYQARTGNAASLFYGSSPGANCIV